MFRLNTDEQSPLSGNFYLKRSLDVRILDSEVRYGCTGQADEYPSTEAEVIY